MLWFTAFRELKEQGSIVEKLEERIVSLEDKLDQQIKKTSG